MPSHQPVEREGKKEGIVFLADEVMSSIEEVELSLF